MTQKGKLLETLKCLLLSYAATIIFLLLLTFLVYQFQLTSAITNIAIICIYILTCFFGAFRLGKQVKQQRFFWGLILGAFYIALLLLISLLVNHTIALSTSNLTVFVLCLVSGMLGGMTS